MATPVEYQVQYLEIERLGTYKGYTLTHTTDFAERVVNLEAGFTARAENWFEDD